MAKRKFEEVSRREFIGVALGAAAAAGIGCSGGEEKGSQGGAGQPGAGGSNPNSGGATANGGANPSNGGAQASGGSSAANGGSSAANGGSTAANGGSTTANGGSSSANGGSSAANGGSSTASGGKASGGSNAGGATGKGGAASGGSTSTSAGGSASGGSGAGGSSGTDTSPKLVGIVRGTDARQATLDAIAAAGGLPDLSQRTVVLKLNLLQNAGPPCTTSAQVVLGVVQAVKAKNAARIIVGDCSMGVGAMAVMASNNTGIHAALAAEGGVTEMDFSANGAADLVVVQPAGAALWPAAGFHIWKAVLDDGSGNKPFVINMPCCKHHGSAVWTLAMKNWIGLLPHGQVAGAANSAVASDRNDLAHQGRLTAALPELHLAVKEDFVVLDAMKAQLTGGPGNGAANTQASPGIVVATKDAVAAEATGLCILREYRKRMATVPSADNIENLKIFNTSANTLMGRALTLNNGWIKSRQEYTYRAVGLGADEALIMAHLDA